MKVLSYVVTALMCVMLCSCGGSEQKGEIQKKFFDVKFGQDKASVSEQLQAQNFEILEGSDLVNKIRWGKKSGKITFGGVEWTRFTTYFYDDIFGEIRFYIDCENNEDEAEAKFKKLKETIEGKYGEFAEVKDKKKDTVSLYELKCSDGRLILSLQNHATGWFSKDAYLIGLTYVLDSAVNSSVSEF